MNSGGFVQPVDYLVCGDYIVTMNESMDLLRDGAVAVKDRRIIDVDTAENILKQYSSERIIGGKDRVVLPGLVNTHTHAAMVYFRGLADDMPLKEWLEGHIWPAENKWLGPDFVFDAVNLACLEMLRAGITTYNDMYFFEGSAAVATKQIGMRAVLGAGIVDFPTVSGSGPDEYLANAEIFVNRWKGDELIVPCIAPHAAYTCSPDTLKKAKTLAEKYDIPLHIHLSETEWEVGEIRLLYGKRPVQHLESIGFLDRRVLAVHCVWLEDDEIEILAERKVGVSHCMESNLKLASGFAPVVAMLAAGIKVTFGTDGAASNNDLNILSEMSTTAKVHKAIAGDPTVLDSKTALTMATRWGAEVLGMGDSTGSLEKGKLADMIIVNLKKPHLTPIYDIYSHIVYAAASSDVESVMVDGKLLISNGNLTAADEDEILQKAFEWGKKIKS